MGSRGPGLIKYGRWGIMFCFQGVGGLFSIVFRAGQCVGTCTTDLCKAWGNGGAHVR